ncbi:hypothetical protein HID58_094693 [Brassica napus]|uniref:Cytochrome f large domain-containing protein n=1 Tax=Brassica napus TaxID=3708 RepID=A0ABQ7X8P0_BRANA|nr:hypothetical protein HID58_094693 [Brassica napus]
MSIVIPFGVRKSFYSQFLGAYPIFAQQNYENPREATGRIVCANCHLASKPVDIEVPQAVLPDTLKQVLANGGCGKIVLQESITCPRPFFFLGSVVLAQIFLVLKKKQSLRRFNYPK